MKNIKSLALILGLTCLSTPVAFASDAPRYGKVPVSEVFIPKGFDSNDSVEVIVSGLLPNLCYKSPSASVEVKGKEVFIEMKAIINSEVDAPCAEMVVPFLEAVNVGLLDRGWYSINVEGVQAGSLYVSQSRSDAVDELVYANVDYVEKDAFSNKVVLKGYNPSDCFEFDHVESIDNGLNVHSVMPIMKQVSEFCPRKMVPFEINWEVPANLDRNQVLLHVRSMNGKSVNSLVKVRK